MGSLIYPAIPDPISTLDSLLETTRAIKEAVELLNGTRGSLGTSKALTAADLTFIFGTTTPPIPGTAPPPTGAGGSGTSAAIAAARAAAQLALQDLRNALENAANDLNNSQEAALAEFQVLLDAETGFRIHGDEVIQQQVDAIILTNDEGAIAAIATETALRISADDALAGQITSLSATVDGNTAAITNEALARAAQDEALAIQINAVTAIASGQQVFVQSTAPTGSVSAPLAVGMVWIDTAHGNLLKTWDGGAWVNSQDAQIGINAAAIVSEQTVRANADTAMAQDITSLTAVVDDGFADINQQLIVLADADTAIASTVTTLSSQVVTNTASITTEQSTRANADAALTNQLTTLQSEVGNNQASVTDELTALADADEAFAEDISTLTTTVNGHTATITQHSASLNGLMAEYSLTININGHIAGFEINSGGGASQFIVQASTFKIVSDAGGTLFTPFVVTGPNVFINRVVVNQEIVSSNYAQDGSGNPTLGFRAGSDGLLRAYDARFVNLQSIGGTFNSITSIGGTFIALSAYAASFVDFTARGGSFTERPVLLATPNFRNGVPDGLPSVRWVSSGSITALGGSQLVNLFARTPDSVTLSITQGGPGGNYVALQTYMVPPGHRLPPRMVADLPGDLNIYVWQDDGTIDRLTHNSNGAVTATVTAAGKWMYDVELDPLILRPRSTNKYICGLGYTRYAQPLRIPEFLFNGTTPVTSVSFKCWGAGGGHDEQSGGRGGPGGFVAGSFTVSDLSGAGFLKRGDMIYLIPGEGGRSRSSDVVFGFGGPGQALDSRSGGGGLSGVFRYSVLRANAMLIAGGGGGQSGSGSADGGPGGAAASGGNGTTGANTDAEIMTGLPWLFNGSNQCAGGGGGYVGGGYLPIISSRQAGRGGSNFVHASATSVTNSSSAVSANGNATTDIPPNSADADFAANDDCLGNLALAGRGKTSTTQAQQGGNGLIVVTFA